jgi:pyridoxamine 5'-phosphate oxidase family protein
MIFTENEIAYIAGQRLGRLATIQSSGQPQLNPVSCYYNPLTHTIDIGGHNMGASHKYRNVLGNPLAAIVIDDMVSGDPAQIRCLEVRGRAIAVEVPHDSAARTEGPIIRIIPSRIVSWGIDPPGLALGSRTIA